MYWFGCHVQRYLDFHWPWRLTVFLGPGDGHEKVAAALIGHVARGPLVWGYYRWSHHRAWRSSGNHSTRSAPDGIDQWQTLMVIGVLLQTMLWGEALEKESVADGHRKCAEITADQCGLMESN